MTTTDTSPKPRIAFDPVEHGGDWITTTLPVSALEAYRQFSAMEKLPVWFPLVQQVEIRSHHASGVPERVGVTARHASGTVDYELVYQFEPQTMRVRWATSADSPVYVSGWAKFTPLTPAACLMEYQLYVDRRELPAWRDPFYENHAPSAVLHHFRDYINRHFH